MSQDFWTFLRSGKLLSQIGFEGEKFRLGKGLGREDKQASLDLINDQIKKFPNELKASPENVVIKISDRGVRYFFKNF